jgi:flagellar basal body-associated protein FliL
MAGKEKEKTEAPPAEEKAPKKGLPIKAIVVALAVVVMEVATVGVTVMMSGGPKTSMAHVPQTQSQEEEKPKEKDAEVKLMDASLANAKHGANRLFLYNLAVVAKVGEKEKEKAKALFEEHDAEIKDRIRTIVASSSPEIMDEPGLETLRRQIKYQLDQDLGKDVIKDLLIPKCTPTPVN